MKRVKELQFRFNLIEEPGWQDDAEHPDAVVEIQLATSVFPYKGYVDRADVLMSHWVVELRKLACSNTKATLVFFEGAYELKLVPNGEQIEIVGMSRIDRDYRPRVSLERGVFWAVLIDALRLYIPQLKAHGYPDTVENCEGYIDDLIEFSGRNAT